MSDNVTMFLFNLGLCLIGCLLAALLGRLTRKTGDLRFFLGVLFVPMLSWFVWVTGGGHGGGGILPTVYLFFLVILSPGGGSWSLFNKNGAINSDLLLFLSLVLFFFLILLSFFVSARSPKPKPRR